MLGPGFDLAKTKMTKKEWADMDYEALRLSIPNVLSETDLSFETVDLEKAIRLFFLQFTKSMTNYLILEIPKFFTFSSEQADLKRQLKRELQRKYEHNKEVGAFYVSPCEMYSQSIQDAKNICLLILEEFFRKGRAVPSTPEESLLKLVYLLEKITSTAHLAQDTNLEGLNNYYIAINNKMKEVYGFSSDQDLPALQTIDFGTQVFPILQGDILFSLEFEQMRSTVEKMTLPTVNKPVKFTPYSRSKEINVFLHRPKLVETYYEVQMRNAFPKEVALQILNCYRTYLQKALPIKKGEIDYLPLRKLIDVYEFLLQNYYYEIYKREDWARIRLQAGQKGLDASVMEELLNEASVTPRNNLEYVQLHPLLKKGQFIYLNGSLLLESFLCQVDHIFKSEPFRAFKGWIMELFVANTLFAYGIEPYNIILSNHPLADSNPKYQNLMNRYNYTLGSEYTQIYNYPMMIHLKCNDVPVFQGHSFVEFDICFTVKDLLFVLECKNVPTYSRRDRIDQTLGEIVRQTLQLEDRLKYFDDPELKQRLVQELQVPYSSVFRSLVVPDFQPFAMNLEGFGLYLESLGFTTSSEQAQKVTENIQKVFGISESTYDEIMSPLEERYEQDREDFFSSLQQARGDKEESEER